MNSFLLKKKEQRTLNLLLVEYLSKGGQIKLLESLYKRWEN